MDFELTPAFAGKSMVIVLIGYVVTLAITFYMLYLNWKQSRVTNQMKELIAEVKEIKEILKRKKK